MLIDLLVMAASVQLEIRHPIDFGSQVDSQCSQAVLSLF